MAQTPSSLGRQSIVVIDADKQFAFAEHYFGQKEYYRAIGEYQRFMFFFPDDSRVEMAMYRIGMSYHNGRKFEDAMKTFQNLIDRYGNGDLAAQAYLMKSESLFQSGRSAMALSTLGHLIENSEDPDIQDEAHYRTGWIYLETASWSRAQSSFGNISEKNRNKYRLNRLSEALEGIDTIKQKNPLTAGFLSVVPGAGYAYLGRFQDALTAFLFNGGLIWATIRAFEDDNPALGGVISFVGVGFYAGNIFGAVSSAHKFNRNQTGNFIQQLKEDVKINLLTDIKHQRIFLAFQYAF